VDNPSRDYNEGAGPAAMQLIASKGSGKIITRHLGGKAALVAKQLGIEMTPLDDRQRSVEEVIQMIKQNS
jgi:predicted Fe-Mo cluster-binding NifX family protein